jgi:hypothetical protein
MTKESEQNREKRGGQQAIKASEQASEGLQVDQKDPEHPLDDCASST